MSESEFTLSLRIRHPNVDPDEITRTLGIEPQHTWKVGDPRLGSAGEALGGGHRESYWMARVVDKPQFSPESVSVESALQQALAQLRRSQDFLARLAESGGVAELHISLFARADLRLDLSSETLALLGRLGLGVSLDLHPHLPGSPALSSVS